MSNLLLQSNFITDCCSFFWQSETFGGNINFAGDGSHTTDTVINLRLNIVIGNESISTNKLSLEKELKS